AEADRRAAVHERRGDESESARLERVDEARVQGVLVLLEAPAQADDPERGRGRELERRAREDAPARDVGEVERPLDRRTEGVEAEVAYRDPDLQRPRGAGELEATIGEVDLVVAGLRVAEVVRRELERASQRRRIAHEQAAALVRL